VLNLGTGEVLVILVVALLVLGPDKLPGAARQAGRWLGELRRLSSGFQAELRDALQEPVDQTPRPTATTAPPPQDEPEPDPGPP
jgi:sec-independent protein translocase protein TatB